MGLFSNCKSWGVEEGEKELPFACDTSVSCLSDAYFRGITINAAPETVFRWLCQMKIAPYSYDWIDNLGRQSPRTLTPGADQLALGQEFMFIFELREFTLNSAITIALPQKRLSKALFGECAITYAIMPQAHSDSCRLLVKLALCYPAVPLGWLLKKILPIGDLIMMRKQLLTFKKLSEREVFSSSKIQK